MPTDCPIDIVIPTRDRPVKLKRCLTAIADARINLPTLVYVVDSSRDQTTQKAVEDVCAEFPFARLHRHARDGFAAARNEATRAGTADVLVTVDDDVYLMPTALDNLWRRYCEGSGWRIVAGSVAWGETWSGPITTRPIGYGKAGTEASADFYVSALLLYPREIARQFPFNETITSSEDRFAGALWRSKHIRMMWEPEAKGQHDDEHNTGITTAYHQTAHIYTNLFDALLVRRSPRWALSVEFLGFAAGAPLYIKSKEVPAYLRAWARGHLALIRDWRTLHDAVSRPFQGNPPEC